MKELLENDDPDLWEKVKDHDINMPSDWEGDYPLFCKKCGKKAVVNSKLLWMCPELYHVPDKYFHSG